jgi:hypothetical protein
MLLMHWASRLHHASWGLFEKDLLLVNSEIPIETYDKLLYYVKGCE